MNTSEASKAGKVFDIILLVLQFVLSGFLIFITFKILPMKFWVLALILLVLLWLISLFTLKLLQLNTRVKRVVSRIFTVIICIVLALVSFVGYEGITTLSNITGGNKETHVVSTIVLKESGYEKINDLDGKTIGYVENIDKERTQKAIQAIQENEKVNAQTTSYESFEALHSALQESEVDAILLNEAYRGSILDINGNFDNETKVIYTYEEEKEVVVADKVKDITDDSFNIFISGIDVYGSVSTVSRSDVNMIVTVNPKTRTILMTSIPRDYYVTLPSFNTKDKLTHAGIYGVNESMNTLANLFNTKINYFAKVNFTSLIKIVDALGGIQVENTQEFVSLHDQTYYPAGLINLDGVTALEFARERYALSGGDGDRIKNHQKILTAILNKAMSPAIISNYSSLLKSVDGSFETNLTSDEIQRLIQSQLNEGGSWTFLQSTVNGSGRQTSECYSMWGTTVYVMDPNYDSVAKATSYIEKVMNGEEVVIE